MDDRQPMEQGTEEFVRELTNQQTAMLAYIRSLMPGNSSTRDVLQEVNVTLWQKKDHFTLGTNFKAWAFQTIRYHMLNHRRRLVSQGWLVFDDDLIERLSPEFEIEPDDLEDGGPVDGGDGKQDRASDDHRIDRRTHESLSSILFSIRHMATKPRPSITPPMTPFWV